MDIGRTLLLNHLPRHRLDAGTFGTMGVGPGFAIAAAVVAAKQSPGKRVICVEGDSAFGFSGMEFEVAARYKLPIVFIVVNNSGIYFGLDAPSLPSDRFSSAMPVTALSIGARYDKIAEVVGDQAAKGYLARTPAELDEALVDALKQPFPTIINVLIRTVQERKQQPHGWLTTATKKQPQSKL
jgi:2-hydroxyacyl-CoA lyase 1